MLNRLSQEVLHARRPTLNYISPAVCEAIFSGSSFPVLVLDALTGLSPIRGLRWEYNSLTGRFRISWDAYPFAFCYNVYRANDPGSPAGVYTLLRSCISTPTFETLDCPECFLVTAVTVTGETPFSDPICLECPPVPEVPPGDPPIIFYNSEQTAVCPAGYSGAPVTKAAGLFTSLFSQVNADAKALEAAESELECSVCTFPPTYYKENYNSADGFDPGPAPVNAFNRYGMIVLVNNGPLPMTLSNLPPDNPGYVTVFPYHSRHGHATYPYDALSHWPDAGAGFVNTGDYVETAWSTFDLVDPTDAQAERFPKQDWFVTTSFYGGATMNTPVQLWDTQGQILTFFVGGAPPC